MIEVLTILVCAALYAIKGGTKEANDK